MSFLNSKNADIKADFTIGITGGLISGYKELTAAHV